MMTCGAFRGRPYPKPVMPKRLRRHVVIGRCASRQHQNGSALEDSDNHVSHPTTGSRDTVP